MSEYSLSLDHTKYPLTVVDGNQLTLSLNGATGPAGANGAAGPNQVTTATTTPLVGYIYGNGTTIAGATAASEYAEADTLVLRNSFGDVHAKDLYCDGDVSNYENGYLKLFDSFNGNYAIIYSEDSRTIFVPASSSKGYVSIHHGPTSDPAELVFTNTTAETYTFPAAGGTLLANTGNLAGLSSPSVARGSLELSEIHSPTFKGLTLTSGSLTASTPNAITQTWNSAGTAFTAVKVDVTATLSSTSSLLLDLRASGASMFSVPATKTSGNVIDFNFASRYQDTTDRVRLIFQTKNFSLASSGASGGRVGLSFNGGSPGSITPLNTSGVSRIVLGNGGGDGAFEGLWLAAANNTSTEVFITADAANVLSQRKSTAAQTSRIYDTYTSSTDYHRLAISTARATATMTGASVTLTGLIPAGAVVVGVTTKVTTAITGATSFSVGTTVAPTRFGTTLPLIIGSTSDNRNWTSGTIECFPTATDIVLTAIGLNFTAGVVYVSVQYMTGQAD